MTKSKHEKNRILDSLDENYYAPPEKKRVTKVKKSEPVIKDKSQKPIRNNLKKTWND